MANNLNVAKTRAHHFLWMQGFQGYEYSRKMSLVYFTNYRKLKEMKLTKIKLIIFSLKGEERI